jgi:hypothetical protein
MTEVQQKAFRSHTHLDSEPHPKQTTPNMLQNSETELDCAFFVDGETLVSCSLTSKFQQWVSLH